MSNVNRACRSGRSTPLPASQPIPVVATRVARLEAFAAGMRRLAPHIEVSVVRGNLKEWQRPGEPTEYVRLTREPLVEQVVWDDDASSYRWATGHREEPLLCEDADEAVQLAAGVMDAPN